MKRSDSNNSGSNRSDSNRSKLASEIPAIENQQMADRICGMLRIDSDIYYIINGLLYKIDESNDDAMHDPCGAIGPAYMFQLLGGSVESLADRNRVLMRFGMIGNEEKYDHMVLGVAARSLDKHGKLLAAGLLNARDLALSGTNLAIALEDSKKESESRRNWFDNLISSTLTSGLDRDAVKKIDRSKELAVKNAQMIHELFKVGFDIDALHTLEFDKKCDEIIGLIEECDLHAISSADLIRKHEIANTLIRESIITSAGLAASAAATVASEGLAAPAFVANIVRGAELFKLGRTLMSSATAVGSLSTVLRYKKTDNSQETIKQNIRNYLDGCLQGAAMQIPVAQVHRVSDLLRIDHVARCLGRTTISHVGMTYRETGKLLADSKIKVSWSIASSAAVSMMTQGLGIQLGKVPIVSDTLRSAQMQLEQCRQMRLEGADAAVIAQLEEQALLKIKIVEHLLKMSKSSAATLSSSAIPALPLALEEERKRIAKKLGKNEISNEELLRHLSLKNVIDYTNEHTSISAVKASVLSQASSTGSDIQRVFRKGEKKKPPAK